MKEIGERLRSLRESLGLSQAKMANHISMTQATVNRYEKALTEPPSKILLFYADYFDVSMDYIYGRTDNPQGKLYEYHPRIEENNTELRQFIDMCFDPDSPIRHRLKETLYSMMLKEAKK